MSRLRVGLALLLAAVVGASPAVAQGVTTGSITGLVVDASGSPLAGARVTALHVPSGTTYGADSRADGRFSIPGMRVGGPYRVTMAAIGYERQVLDNVTVSLGLASDLRFSMSQSAVALADVTVTAERETVINIDRTGAATSVPREALERLPTVTGRIQDFIRLTPEARGSNFAGQDNRMNNITVDGSYFNNSFGLSGQPGDRTGVAPISMEAIEQLQVAVAPYDVRQGNFVGAGVNTVTKSGTNEMSAALYFQYRNQGLVGKEVQGSPFDPGTFKYDRIGARLSGPVIRNKLFFFLNYEGDGLTEPGTTFKANAGSQTVEKQTTRVLASDLTTLSSFLGSKLNYQTGPFADYDHETPATRILAKADYNLSDRHKLSLRYNHLDSRTDVLVSNSSSLGFGNRRSRLDALNFQNSNYQIKENIRSIVGEWNAIIGSNKANNLILGYTSHDESRDSRGEFFPFVDILKDGSTYTSFGFEPFTPNNELRYSSLQLQNNFTIYGVNHDLTFGASIERYRSENVFFPGSQSVYTYNSLQDFYTDVNDYAANPNRTTSPVTLRRFQVRWSNIPGQDKPIQPLEVVYAGVYAQDEWRVRPNLKVTAGLRLDVPYFSATGFTNTAVDGMTFRDETGAPVKYSTSQLPGRNLLWSPRLGVNWDVKGNREMQVRGGTGIFTGRPAYVWVSNQIGENGVLTGFEQVENTRNRPFNPNPDHYKPTNVTGAPASSYALAFSDPDFKFPQVWRSNLAVDRKLPFGLVGTGEFLYTKDVNGIYYINANLPAANTKFNGPDDRPRWTVTPRINSAITSAVVLKNQNVGSSWNLSGSVEKDFRTGLFAKAAYSYGVAKNTVDPSSIAFGNWSTNPISGDPNNPGASFSNNSPGHRVFTALSYAKEFFKFGQTTVSLFWEGRTLGNASYTFSGDLNGDGGTSNDLIYVHKNAAEMNFETYSVTINGVSTTFTAAQQAAAWDAFIEQDKYLRTRRGQYAERGAVFLPMVYNLDVSLSQDVFTDIRGKRNRIQFRLDILNAGNLIDSKWGTAQRLVTTQPLIARGADAGGVARYRLRNIGDKLISNSLERTAGINDVFRIQLSARYTWN